jgi:hypothetical protein
MRSFFLPHIILEIGKQRDLRNKIYQTVGDANLILHTFQITNRFGSSRLLDT